MLSISFVMLRIRFEKCVKPASVRRRKNRFSFGLMVCACSLHSLYFACRKNLQFFFIIRFSRTDNGKFNLPNFNGTSPETWIYRYMLSVPLLFIMNVRFWTELFKHEACMMFCYLNNRNGNVNIRHKQPDNWEGSTPSISRRVDFYAF